MISEIVCIVLFMWGMIFRDGFPALGRTQAARGLGAVTCGLGALCVNHALNPVGAFGYALPFPLPTFFLAITCAVWSGFYTDTDHAAGQGGYTAKDAEYLTLSGVTSLAPLAVVEGIMHGWGGAGIIAMAAFAKPVIWLAAWYIRPDLRVWSFLEPTRVGAALFGVVMGASVALLK